MNENLVESPASGVGSHEVDREDDAALLERAMASESAATLDAVFRHSHALGSGFRRYYGVDLTLPDLARLLPQLGSPCHEQGLQSIGAPATAAPARRSERLPCGATPAACTFWREATLGLVSGTSSTVYFTRVSSPLGGGASCVDVLHLEALSDACYQPPPPTVHQAVRDASSELERTAPGARVEVLGLQEGALHVRVHGTTAICGLDPFTVLKGALARAVPALVIRDASAKPVLAP